MLAGGPGDPLCVRVLPHLPTSMATLNGRLFNPGHSRLLPDNLTTRALLGDRSGDLSCSRPLLDIPTAVAVLGGRTYGTGDPGRPRHDEGCNFFSSGVHQDKMDSNVRRGPKNAHMTSVRGTTQSAAAVGADSAAPHRSRCRAARVPADLSGLVRGGEGRDRRRGRSLEVV